MTISGFRIHNILKTYHKNIRWTEKETGGGEERTHGRDRAEISVEGRRAQICQKAANDVVERLTKAENTTASSPEKSQ